MPVCLGIVLCTSGQDTLISVRVQENVPQSSPEESLLETKLQLKCSPSNYVQLTIKFSHHRYLL